MSSLAEIIHGGPAGASPRTCEARDCRDPRPARKVRVKGRYGVPDWLHVCPVHEQDLRDAGELLDDASAAAATPRRTLPLDESIPPATIGRRRRPSTPTTPPVEPPRTATTATTSTSHADGEAAEVPARAPTATAPTTATPSTSSTDAGLGTATTPIEPTAPPTTATATASHEDCDPPAPAEGARADCDDTPEAPMARPPLPEIQDIPGRCRWKGCEEAPFSRGLCRRHNSRARHAGTLDAIGLPPVSQKDAARWRRHGRPSILAQVTTAPAAEAVAFPITEFTPPPAVPVDYSARALRAVLAELRAAGVEHPSESCAEGVRRLRDQRDVLLEEGRALRVGVHAVLDVLGIPEGGVIERLQAVVERLQAAEARLSPDVAADVTALRARNAELDKQLADLRAQRDAARDAVLDAGAMARGELAVPPEPWTGPDAEVIAALEAVGACVGKLGTACGQVERLDQLAAGQERTIRELEAALTERVDDLGARLGRLAADALAALAGAGVSTPAEGYVAAPQELRAGIERLAKERDDYRRNFRDARTAAEEAVPEIEAAHRVLSDVGTRVVGLVDGDPEGAPALTVAERIGCLAERCRAAEALGGHLRAEVEASRSREEKLAERADALTDLRAYLDARAEGVAYREFGALGEADAVRVRAFSLRLRYEWGDRAAPTAPTAGPAPARLAPEMLAVVGHLLDGLVADIEAARDGGYAPTPGVIHTIEAIRAAVGVPRG